MTPTIEPARITDIPRLVDLLGILLSIEVDFSVDVMRQRRGLELLIAESASRGRICVAVARDHQGQVIGMASAQLVVSTAEGALSAWIEDVVVHPDFRRQGLGKALLEYLLAWAKARGASRAQLIADTGSLSAGLFYDDLGWQTTQLGVRRKFIA